MSALIEKKISSEQIYDGTLLHVRRDEIELPDGKKSAREYIRHIGAVCVIPIDGDGNVIVERQYRYPVSEVLLEIPAGKLNTKDEDRLEAVRRELREETGCTAGQMIFLGNFYPTPAYTDENISMYLALDLTFGERHLDDDEFIDVEKIPLDTLYGMVMNGEIPDSKTQLAVLKAKAILG